MQNSSIEWTDHTFNPWIGCTRVGPACKYCYAALIAARFNHAEWGDDAERKITKDDNWRKPVTWNRRAAALGVRQRVFCGSMCDWAEERGELNPHRARLFDLIGATPSLDWLLLSKRAHAIQQLVPWADQWPHNVWAGVTVENQKYAARRLPYLVELPAVVRFISAEPLLGPLDLSPWIDRLDWVIAGGESGSNPRPSNPAWFHSLQQHCAEAGVAFLFKQWGNYAPDLGQEAGGRCRHTFKDGTPMIRWSKAQAGRLLAGRTWNELPTPRPA